MRVCKCDGLLGPLIGYRDKAAEIGTSLERARDPDFSWAAPRYQREPEVLGYRFTGDAHGAYACLGVRWTPKASARV